MGNAAPCCGERGSGAREEHVNNVLRQEADLSDIDRCATCFDDFAQEVCRLNKAVANSNMAELVSLIDSKASLNASFKQNPHPWAATPTHVGGLAVCHIGMIASMAYEGGKKDPKLLDDMYKAGGLGKLLACLSSTQKDRKEYALVAISHISCNNEDCAEALYQAKGMDQMMPFLDKKSREAPHADMRFLASSAIRPMLVSRDARINFDDLGGTPMLVELLQDIKKDPHKDRPAADVLDALLTLIQGPDDDEPDVVEALVESCRDAKAAKVVEGFVQSRDEDAAQFATTLFAMLNAPPEKRGR